MENPSLEVNGKTVLILGGSSLESVEDKIVALGHTFQERSLPAQPCDWIEIENNLMRLNASGELLTVLMLLSERDLIDYSSSDYLFTWNTLLKGMKKVTSLIFLEEDC